MVIGTVFGGYVMTGGHLGALYQPAELVIIGGAGIGRSLSATTEKPSKALMKAIPLLRLLCRRNTRNLCTWISALALLLSPDGQITPAGDVLLNAILKIRKESEIFS